MKSISVVRRVCLVCLAFLLLLCSCGSGTAISTEDAGRMEVLGGVFLEDLKGMLPYRQSDEHLLKLEAVVQIDDRTYNFPLLEDFRRGMESGENGQLTAVFKSASFVVVRLVYENGAGYYFRYEFDKFHEDDINISSQRFDELQMADDETLNKVEMSLIRDKNTPIVLAFRNIVEEQSQ